MPLLAIFRTRQPTAVTVASVFPTGTVELLDATTDDALPSLLASFTKVVLPVVFHPDVFTRRARFIRHGLNHLLRGSDALAERLARCISPTGAYFVAGLGVGFWSAVAELVPPHDLPRWCLATENGLRRLALLRDLPADPRTRFDAFARAAEVVRSHAPDLSGQELSAFLECVGRTAGRELPAPGGPGAFAWGVTAADIEQAIREIRTHTPLRARIRATSEARDAAINAFQTHAQAGEFTPAFRAFREAFPDARWEAALPALDDAYSPLLPEDDRARLWCEVAGVLRDRFRVHPLELADVALTVAARSDLEPEPDGFGGFCSDTFTFLEELAVANAKGWMATHRDRYHFSLREPLLELCDAVAERYVRPVLNREHGWGLE
ncbi:MAG: DUF2461 domain-containing protein, partial [Gemmataceae bacterium]|nr:DUF2461 domain-containing protein [Gemmataceae bacterium]